MKTIPHILSQHAEEAAFKWLLRNRAIHQPHYRLKDLARLDSAVDAHLDGLRVAGEAGWECVQQELSHQEAGEFFTAAWLSLALGKRAAFEAVIDTALRQQAKDREIETAIVSAIVWLEEPLAERIADDLLASEDLWRRRLGLIASGELRRLTASKVLRLLDDPPDELLLPLLKAAGESNFAEVVPVLRNIHRDTSGEIRFRAAWAAAISGDAASIGALREFIRAELPFAADAVALYFRRAAPAEAAETQRLLANHPASARLAIQAAGAMGLSDNAEYLIDCMAAPNLARSAAEALATITGLDLDWEDLSTNAPADFEAGPTEDPEDDSTELDPDENLPWPDPIRVRNCWNSNREILPSGKRHLMGKPITAPNLTETLATGRQRQRAAAALELVLLQRGSPLFNTAAPARDQCKRLS